MRLPPSISEQEVQNRWLNIYTTHAHLPRTVTKLGPSDVVLIEESGLFLRQALTRSACSTVELLHKIEA